jgi:hypothetical protein
MSYETTLIDYIQMVERNANLRPLILGGVSGGDGGNGGPPGGFVGYLPQWRIAYDSTEAATLATISGGSILDNLNHIRYMITTISGGGGGIGTETDPIFTASEAFLFESGDKSKLDAIEANANNYVLPVATVSVLGGIKVGTGLEIVAEVLNVTISGGTSSSDYFNPNSFVLGAYDDHFNSGSLDGSWTILNPSTMTVDTNTTIPHCVTFVDCPPDATEILRGIIKTLPATGDWQITTRALFPPKSDYNVKIGIFVTANLDGSGLLECVDVQNFAAIDTYNETSTFTDKDTFSATYGLWYEGGTYLRLKWVSGTLYYQRSVDGGIWDTISSNVLGYTPLFGGLYIDNNDLTSPFANHSCAFDWFKVDIL